MPRTGRTVQFDLDPGESAELQGPFFDGDTKEPVRVYVRVRACDDEGETELGRRFDQATGRWQITLPPDTVEDFNGLVGEDGVPLTLTIATGECGETDTGGEDPYPFDPREDVTAYARAEPVFEDDPDVMAEEMDLPE